MAGEGGAGAWMQGYGYAYPYGMYGYTWAAGTGAATMYPYGYGMAGYGYGGQAGGNTAASYSTGSSCAADDYDALPSAASSSKKPQSSSKGLLEELKAKQAAREEQKRLRKEIDACDEQDDGRKAMLQCKLNSVEQSLRAMGDDVDGPGGPRTSQPSSAHGCFRPPEDGRQDQFGRFCHVLVQHLRTCEGHASLLSLARLERSIAQEWSDLVKSRVVDGAAKMEQVLRARPNVFELSRDKYDKLVVKLADDYDAAAGASGAPREGLVLTGKSSLEPEKIASIEAYLKKAGGSEQISRLETLFGVKKAQLSRYFSVYEDRKRLYAAPLTGAARSAAFATVTAVETELRELEGLLRRLKPTRALVGEAMAFCTDNGARHAPALSRRLIKALEEPDLDTDSAISRLYVVSDVLFNANSGVKGAARYRTAFQDLLPDAFERLGRQWLQKAARGRIEQERGREAVLAVLHAWRCWAAFPPLFVRGLEALVMAAVRPERPGASDEESLDEELGPALRRRLARWRGLAADQARVPYAARLRGLAGSTLAASTCRARLCHYERYWDGRGNVDEFDPFEEPVEPPKAALVATLDVDFDPDMDGESLSEGDLDEDPCLDGEPLPRPAGIPLLGSCLGAPPGAEALGGEPTEATSREPAGGAAPDVQASPLKRKRSG